MVEDIATRGHVDLTISYQYCDLCGDYATHQISIGDDQIYDYCLLHFLEGLDALHIHWARPNEKKDETLP